jgi:hypothetical protein
MSDNPADAAPALAPDAAPAPDAPTDAPATETPPSTPPEPPADPIAPEAAKPIEAPKWVKPAMDRLTREKHEARRALENAERERDLYKAMAEGRQPPADGATPTPPTTPAPAPRHDDVEIRARQLVEQEKTETKLNDMISTGAREFGEAAFNDKSAILVQLGARDAPGFMDALVTVPEGHKVVAALADDPDKLVSLLRMGPVAMGVEMGRLAAELSAPKPPKPVSAAPAPVAAPVGRTQPAPDIYNTASMSMKEYAAHRAKTAPRSLGGQGRPR